ncbi:MAG: AroM family protein [Thermodesulfobacteriota bacterium]
MILRRIGMITIGQSPRIDIIPEMKDVLGQDVEILESGALDGLSLEEVKQFFPRSRDYILCTRMADGTEVVVAKRFIIPRVQKCIDLLLERGAEIIVLICTGRFPSFPSKKLFIEAQKILDHFILALHGEKERIGLMIPLSGQIRQARRKYGRLKGRIVIQAASPYASEDEVSVAAEALKKANPHVIVMHCMGYTQAMKKRVMEITGKPTILARTLVARTVKELISD